MVLEELAALDVGVIERCLALRAHGCDAEKICTPEDCNMAQREGGDPKARVGMSTDCGYCDVLREPLLAKDGEVVGAGGSA